MPDRPAHSSSSSAAWADAGLTPLGRSPPRRLGDYVVVGRIGTDPEGTLYAGCDVDRRRSVAIKVALACGPAVPLPVAVEVRHANLVPVYEVGRAGELAFHVMERVDGKTLGQWLDDAPPGWRAVVRSFVEAGRGLRAIHEAGLVHADFRAENVIVGVDGRVRLMGLGLQPAMDRLSAADTHARGARVGGRLAPDSGLLEAASHLAPEAVEAGVSDARADVFSFCVALHVALYGRFPYAAPDVDTLLTRMAAGQRAPIPPSATRRVPAWVAGVVARGLEPDPGRRWPSMAHLLAALSDDPGRRRIRLMVYGVAAAIAAGLLSALAVRVATADPDSGGSTEPSGAQVDPQSVGEPGRPPP